MKDREPTIRSRELGEALRHAMKEAGFTASQMARQLDWSPSRVSRLFSGKRGGSSLDVSAFLGVCGVRGPEKERLLNLALDQHRPGFLQPHLPTQLRTLINHENKAVAIREFQFNLIPGVLQTDAYIRALHLEAGLIPEEEIDDRVRAKLGRQNLLSRSDLSFTFYVHEFALRLPIGGSVVMSEQLHKLLRMSVRPNLTLRVVPASVGGHAAIAGSFRLMEFKAIPPIVYLDSETSGLFLELPIEIRAYKNILTALDTTALPEGQSREFITRVAVELYAEDPDDLAKEQLQR
jgi:transcriptional regulator with XRE-family HTH domain